MEANRVTVGRQAARRTARRPSPGHRRATRAAALLVAVAALAAVRFPRSAAAGDVVDVLKDARLKHLGLAPLAPVLANAVALTYPTASASGSIVYLFDPDTGTYERHEGVLAPIFGERAEVIGRHAIAFSTAYSYVHLATVDGQDLDDLQSRRTAGGRILVLPVRNGAFLRDNRFTNFLPVSVRADLAIDAHLVEPSVTYGVTNDLDVNVTVPVVRSRLGVTATAQVPDPRFPAFRLPRGSAAAGTETISVADDAAGIGDLLLRAKYLLRRGSLADVAAGLGLRLPTGNEGDLHGTGTTRVEPSLIVSSALATRLQWFGDVGMDINTDVAERSAVLWSLGATFQMHPRIAATVVALARHELAAQTDPIPAPFFLQVHRNDEVDLSAGLRWRIAERLVLGLNAIVPLNDDGFRPDVVPTAELEYTL